jgi:SpoVK/Ycf46/Vps4 family AAA+-type ATPase
MIPDKELERLLISRIKDNHEAQLEQVEETTLKIEDSSKARKPIVSSSIMRQLQECIAAIKHHKRWVEWGFTSSNSVALFEGPPGTGKTTSAWWLAKQLEKKIIIVSFADVGSEKPGQSERNIRDLFAAARRRRALIFLDDAEALVRSRASLPKDEQWLVSVIGSMLVEIEAYDGPIILATNLPDMIDTGMARRVAYRVRFDLPDEKARLMLWRAMWPKGWPLDYSGSQVNKFVKRYVQTGAQIEMAIENAARAALVEDRDPTWADLDRACQSTVA